MDESLIESLQMEKQELEHQIRTLEEGAIQIIMEKDKTIAEL